MGKFDKYQKMDWPPASLNSCLSPNLSLTANSSLLEQNVLGAIPEHRHAKGA